MKYAIRAALIAIPLSASVVAAQAPVNLNAWQQQSYPAVQGFGAGNWIVAPDNNSVRQTVNGQPTMFASDFNSQGTEVSGRIRVQGSDDDYIGFALGYHIGDITSSAADYLLVDWKAVNQDYDFGAPSNTTGGLAPRGLAVSRVTGIPNADEFWTHSTKDGGGGLEQLQRGLTRGNTGWARNTDYDFRFFFTGTQLQVYVNNTLELDIAGNFNDGSMAFYNFSQAEVTYSAFTVRRVDVVAPEPASVVLMAAGLLAVGAAVRKKRKA